MLLGVATHKLSRLIATDTATSPLRAPFTRYEGGAGVNEVSETPRGEGPRRAFGELIRVESLSGLACSGPCIHAQRRGTVPARLACAQPTRAQPVHNLRG